METIGPLASSIPALHPPTPLELLMPEGRRNPYPIYRRLHELPPIYRHHPGFWVVRSHQAALTILRDSRFLRVGLRPILHLAIQTEGPFGIEQMRNAMLMGTLEAHARTRYVGEQVFGPRMIETLRPRVQKLADSLLSRVQGATAMDAIAEYAFPLPVLVLAELLGIPEAEHARLLGWASDWTGSQDPKTDHGWRARTERSTQECTSYLGALVKQRFANPGTDLMSQALLADNNAAPLTENELTFAGVMLLAGYETASSMIGNAILALLQHPAQTKILRARPELWNTAIEELLRYAGPVQATGRRVTETVELEGVTMREGDLVCLLLSTANHDPKRFDDPERLDLTRANVQHVAFGEGVFICLAAQMARMEVEVALRTLLERFPALSLAESNVHWMEQVTLRRLAKLDVRL